MAAKAVAGEVAARAMPVGVFLGEVIAIVVASEVHAEIGKGDSLRLLSIALSLVNLADQTGIHITSFP